MRPGPASKGASRYVVGEVERFSQKNDMFSRTRWDPSLSEIGEKLWAPQEPDQNIAGHTLQDYALENAAWFIPIAYTGGNYAGNRGLYSWDAKPWGLYGKPKTDVKLEVYDPVKMTRTIKKIARLLGASLVGITELDRRWVYSEDCDLLTGKTTPITIPEEYKYAIVLGYEMDYELIQMSSAHTHGLGVGICYTKMAVVGPELAQFIRLIGYKAIPMGNDTANSIPLAIDAGLGELGRLNLLITPQYGPRVRLSKVFTNLPLVPDKPIEFGVWDFCMTCKKCAKNCPGQALSYDEPTDQPNSISNRKGILRWPIKADKCAGWFGQNGGDCANCIRVCPFNKPPGPLHDAVRWGIKHTPVLNPLFVKVDDALGYGRRVSARKFWD